MLAVRLEARVELRYRVVAVVSGLTALWCLLLLALPEAAAAVVGPYLLVIDTVSFAVGFLAALFLFERGEGALRALLVSPLRSVEYLGVKVLTLTALATAAAIPIALVAGRGGIGDAASVAGLIGPVALTVAVSAALLLALSFAVVVSHEELLTFLLVASGLLVPFLLVPLVHLADLVTGPAGMLLYVVPTTGAAELIRAAIDPDAARLGLAGSAVAVGYLLVWFVGALVVALRRFERELVRPRVRPVVERPRRAARRTVVRVRHWTLALGRLDAWNAGGTAMLALIALGMVLLALALRFGYPSVNAYVLDRYGLDLTPYEPVLLVALVVLHVAVIAGMVGGLLLLDDLDDRRLIALRVTPVTLGRYLGYRLTTVGLAGLAGLIVAVPVSGLATGSVLAQLPVLVLAAAQSCLVMLVVAAVARNKVEGLAVLKAAGGVVTLVGPAVWWLPDLVGWVLLALPPAWVAHAMWAGAGSAGQWLFMLGGAALTLAAGAVLMRRTLSRVG